MSNKVRARKETPVATTQLTSIYLLGKLPGEGNKEVKLRQIPTEQFSTIIAVVAGSCSHFLCLTGKFSHVVVILKIYLVFFQLSKKMVKF